MAVSVIHRQNQMTYNKLRQLQHNQKNSNVRERQYQTEIECDHLMGSD